MNRKDVKKNCTLNIKNSATVSKGRNNKKITDQGLNLGKMLKASNNHERMASLNRLDSFKNTIDQTKSILHTTEGEKAGDGTKIDIKISVNYSEKGEGKKKEKDKVKILELRKNNKSFNNLITKNSLKASKTLKNSGNHKRNISQADIIHNNLNISLFTYENNGKINNYFKSPKKIINNNNSFAFNNQMLNRICNPCKTEVNDENKIEEQNVEQSASREIIDEKDRNTITLTQTQTLPTDHNQYSTKQKSEDLAKYFKNLNKKFDQIYSNKSYSSNTNNETLSNQTNNLNKLKSLFSELVNNNSVPESNVFFTKLNNCITDLINHLMMQNNYILIQKNKESDNLKKKYNDISSKFIQSAITLEEKNKEIRKLKERLKEMNGLNIEDKKANYQTIENLISDEECLITESVEIDNGKNKIITNMNKENIDDLEAIYFYDKVHMRSNSENEFKVPKLNLNLAMEKVNNLIQRNKNEDYKKELKGFNSPGGKNAVKKKIQTIILSEKVNKNSLGFIKMNSKVDLTVNKVEKK